MAYHVRGAEDSGMRKRMVRPTRTPSARNRRGRTADTRPGNPSCRQGSIDVHAERGSVVQATAEILQARASRAGQRESRRFLVHVRSCREADDGCNRACRGHELPRPVRIDRDENKPVPDFCFVNAEMRPELLEHAGCAKLCRLSHGSIRARHRDQFRHRNPGEERRQRGRAYSNPSHVRRLIACALVNVHPPT